MVKDRVQSSQNKKDNDHLSFLFKEIAWAKHLKTTNRFFLPDDMLMTVDNVIKIIGNKPPKDLSKKKFWRARKFEIRQVVKFSKEEMGAPPVDKARGGRVNPEGIPCLYLSDSIKTAISETRPWGAAKLCVAGFRLRKQPKVADLRIETIIGDVSAVPAEKRKEALAFLYFLLVSFSRPVQEENAVDYSPSQYFAQRLKHLGYEGIVYPSMMHKDGYNLAMFDSKKAADLVGRVEIYQVKSVDYTSSKLKEC